jgi:hypothetical protein
MNKASIVGLASGVFLFFNIAAVASPSVQFPTGNAAWTVDITQHYPSIGSKRKPQKVDVTQVDNVKKISITWTDGQTTEEWSLPNLPVLFKEYPNGGVFSVSTASDEVKEDRANIPSDAPDFSWISPQSLQEKDPISYQGKSCFHYKKSTKEAWIDETTLLPVAIENGNTLCVFTFQDKPPLGPLVPSQKVADEIKYYKHIMGFP